MIEFVDITKSFGRVQANGGISFVVNDCEIHAILGENGAGKSTLMKILSGCLHPDKGELKINGTSCHFKSPLDAKKLGIGMVHQGLSLIPSLTVMENIALGMDSITLFKKSEIKAEILEFESSTGMGIMPEALVWELSHGQKQLVEIFKQLFLGSKILILDEPTTSLTPHEANVIFSHLNKLKAHGYTILLVTHKLSDIISYTDTVTVLRNGEIVSTVKTADTTEQKLAAMMVGQDNGRDGFLRDWDVGDDILKVDNISAVHNHRKRTLKDLTFSVKSGELFGIAGVSGNGQEELIEVLTGTRKYSQGTVIFAGKVVDSSEFRISYIPEDRIGVGTVSSLSIADNLILRDFNRPPYSNGFILDFEKISIEVSKRILAFKVKTTSSLDLVSTLSGGNIQRVILARELCDTPDLIVAVNPTSGLDVAGIHYVHSVLAQQAVSGAAILVVSENLDELLLISHRIMVLCDGLSMGIFDTPSADKEIIGMCMGGKIHHGVTLQ